MLFENVSTNESLVDSGSIINPIINSFGTGCNGDYRVSNTNTNEDSLIQTNQHAEKSDIIPNIYRYKFTEDFMIELYKFSKIHQYDHRKDFKEAWNIWLEEEEELIESEIRRLTGLGYDGDILDKMFKSARYYFRKKSTEKKEPVERRTYISVRKELLDAMDYHIKSNITNPEYKPSEAFATFCRGALDLLKEEVGLLCKNGFNDTHEISDKFKKTYKNRYFIITNK